VKLGGPIAIGCAATLLATLGWLAMERPARAGAHDERNDAVTYASPLEIATSPDGARLYVLCQQAQEVRVLDAATMKPLSAVHVGAQPRGMTLSSSGDRLFVTNSWDDTVSVIDTAKMEVTATWASRGEPSGVVLSRDGKHLFVANRVSNDIAVLDAATGEEEKRLMAGRGSSYLTASPDGSRIYATHVYPNSARHLTPEGNREIPESEITVIDAAEARVVERIPLHAVAGEFHTAFSADGRLGVVAAYHPKNLVPLAHLEHGGAFAFTLELFGEDVGKPVEVPLDELDRYATNPFGVAITPDKTRLFVTLGGAESVVAIDVPKLLSFVKTHPRPASGSFATDLGASGNYVIGRIAVGHNPRGVALSKDGKRLFVANRLEDTISVIDTHTAKLLSTVPLDGPKMETALRHGERTFYTAQYSFQAQIGCATCHIDSTFDGLTWDLEPDGFGRDVVDNRLIEDLSGTEPFKWNGGNPSIPVECGPRTEKYFWRAEQYDNMTLADVAMYMLSLPSRPNRWRQPGADLTPAQERGQALFERRMDKFGKPIAEENRCVYCHSGAKGTIQKSFDVGTRKATDNTGRLDTPQLSNVAMTAPYLHDGTARTLEEIWTIYNPDDKHGRTNDLTKDELNDLIEYLKTR
jgi:YVTN family beta-propeller protein